MKYVILTLAALAITSGTTFASVSVLPSSYTGSRTTDNGLVGNSAWAGDGTGDHEFAVSWEITPPASGSTWWTYKYWVDGVAKSPSHATFELSPIFDTEPDRLRFPWGDDDPPAEADYESSEIKTYTPGAASDPGLLEEFFGIKVNSSLDVEVFFVHFESTQSPMWGDFYAKDGVVKVGTGKDAVHIDVYAQNIGIGNDPSGSDFTNWIAVPDTLTTGAPPGGVTPPELIPEPTRALLLLAGLGASVFRRRRGR